MLKKSLSILATLGLFTTVSATNKQEYLIKVTPSLKTALLNSPTITQTGTSIEDLKFNNWLKIETPAQIDSQTFVNNIKKYSGVLTIQPNYKVSLLNNYKFTEEQIKAIANNQSRADDCPFPIPIPGICDDPDDGGTPNPGGGKASDNPAIPGKVSGNKGSDPLLEKQWGMKDIGVKEAWKTTKGNPEIVVAVIDTGVDYTHEDLVENLWRNPGETGTDENGNDKATNGVDDDNNGYVDDSIGWDFVSNDNKPYDLSVSGIELAFGGGNPGHGTHCAGNVAARGDNGKGIAGVAPNVKIMSIRFLSEKGQGTTADAIKAVRYAIDNGAQVLSNSWGSEGEDPGESQENQALRDVIAYSQEKGRLFIAAAGNGHQGIGYDNDTDSKPGYPASYDHDIIVSVAAIDNADNFGRFSNWGKKTVDIAAPGVKVFSTMVGGKYNDIVLNLFGQTVYWDGTSMATPHVAGAAALYWSAHPEASWQDVKSALLNSVEPVSQFSNKLSSGGKLNVKNLMNQ